MTSYFQLLYVLPIVGAAAVQMRRGARRLALLSALLYGALVLHQYAGGSGYIGGAWVLDVRPFLPPIRVASYTVAANAIAFVAVALLSGSLAERLQRADDRLAVASTALADLQAFNQHVIESLTSGLITTDRGGRVVSLNRAAEQIIALPARAGHRAAGRRPAPGPADVCRAARRRARRRRQPARRLRVSHRRRRSPRDRVERRTPGHARWPGGLPADVPGRHRDPPARARRAPTAAAGRGRRDGSRHRARDSQPAGVDAGIDSGPAVGAVAQRRAGQPHGHRAARVGPAQRHDSLVSRVRAPAGGRARAGGPAARAHRRRDAAAEQPRAQARTPRHRRRAEPGPGRRCRRSSDSAGGLEPGDQRPARHARRAAPCAWSPVPCRRPTGTSNWPWSTTGSGSPRSSSTRSFSRFTARSARGPAWAWPSSTASSRTTGARWSSSLP